MKLTKKGTALPLSMLESVSQTQQHIRRLNVGKSWRNMRIVSQGGKLTTEGYQIHVESDG